MCLTFLLMYLKLINQGTTIIIESIYCVLCSSSEVIWRWDRQIARETILALNFRDLSSPNPWLKKLGLQYREKRQREPRVHALVFHIFPVEYLIMSFSHYIAVRQLNEDICLNQFSDRLQTQHQFGIGFRKSVVATVGTFCSSLR